MNEPLSKQGAAIETPAYLRHPTLHGDRIAFVADDDLWTVPAAGGIARRLTAGLSEPSTPSLSPPDSFSTEPMVTLIWSVPVVPFFCSSRSVLEPLESFEFGSALG